MQITNNPDYSYMPGSDTSKSDSTLQKIASLKALQAGDSASRTIADQLGMAVSSMQAGLNNAYDASSILQIAGGVTAQLGEETAKLAAMSVRYNNASLTTQNQHMLEREFSAQVSGMRQSIEEATYNGKNIFGSEMNFSLGSGEIGFALDAMNTGSLSIASGESIRDFANALEQNNAQIGSARQGIDSAIANLSSMITSTAAAQSQIEDTDVADAMSQYNAEQIRLEASTLAQAHKTESLRNRMEQLLGL